MDVSKEQEMMRPQISRKPEAYMTCLLWASVCTFIIKSHDIDPWLAALMCQWQGSSAAFSPQDNEWLFPRGQIQDLILQFHVLRTATAALKE